MQKFKIMFFDETANDLIDLKYKFFVLVNGAIESGWEFWEDAQDAKGDFEDVKNKRVKRISNIDSSELNAFCQRNGYQLHVVM